MKRITIVIETGNAAFGDSEPGNAAFEAQAASETARILRAMADRLEATGLPPVPRDINGNVVGSVSVEELE